MKININYLRLLPIENLSLINTFPLAILLIGVLDFLLFNFSLDLGKKIFNLFSRSSSEKTQVGISNDFPKSLVENKNQDLGLSQKGQPLIDAEEGIEIVMKRLGISWNHEEGGKKQGKLNFDDLLDVFEEEKVILDEVKEAFDVFDENRDGFIDAEDLQRVLLALGFHQGLELEKCRKMIIACDEGNDGRIDFDGFLRFMENNYC